MNGITQYTPEQERQKTPMAARAETIGFSLRLIDAALDAYPEERTVSASALKDTVAFTPETAPPPAPGASAYNSQTEMADNARDKLSGLFN